MSDLCRPDGAAVLLSHDEACDLADREAHAEWGRCKESLHAVDVAQHARDVEAVRAFDAVGMIRGGAHDYDRLSSTAFAEVVKEAIVASLEGRHG